MSSFLVLSTKNSGRYSSHCFGKDANLQKMAKMTKTDIWNWTSWDLKNNFMFFIQVKFHESAINFWQLRHNCTQNLHTFFQNTLNQTINVDFFFYNHFIIQSSYILRRPQKFGPSTDDLTILKVSKFRKQIVLYSFEPKTKRNISALRIDP